MPTGPKFTDIPNAIVTLRSMSKQVSGNDEFFGPLATELEATIDAMTKTQKEIGDIRQAMATLEHLNPVRLVAWRIG